MLTLLSTTMGPSATSTTYFELIRQELAVRQEERVSF